MAAVQSYNQPISSPPQGPRRVSLSNLWIIHLTQPLIFLEIHTPTQIYTFDVFHRSRQLFLTTLYDLVMMICFPTAPSRIQPSELELDKQPNAVFYRSYSRFLFSQKNKKQNPVGWMLIGLESIRHRSLFFPDSSRIDAALSPSPPPPSLLPQFLFFFFHPPA